MIWFILVLLVAVAVGLIVWTHIEPPTPEPDPETITQTAIELHRIRRRIDAADLKQRQRRDAVRLKREIAEALEDKSW
jgi:hypothetical protein